jgi:hypothetical protein
VILDQQDAPRRACSRLLFHADGRSTHDGERQHQPHGRPNSWHRLDLGVSTVSLYDAVYLGQAETGAGLALCCEKGLECALTHFGRHTNAGVSDFDAHLATGRVRPNGQRAASGHRVERVLDEIEQRLAQLPGDTAHHHAAPEVPLELYNAAFGPLGPERTRHRDDLVADL